jgi:hypothetical protein
VLKSRGAIEDQTRSINGFTLTKPMAYSLDFVLYNSIDSDQSSQREKNLR